MNFIRILPKMDSVAHGIWDSPRHTAAKGQWSSQPTGAETLRLASTQQRQITVRSRNAWLNFIPHLPSFLLSWLIVIQGMRTYIGWLFQSQPPTSSRVRDKYCLRSSTFHARLPPPVPWPAKSEGWNSCQMPSPVSFRDDWKEVLSRPVFKERTGPNFNQGFWWHQQLFKKSSAF